MTADLERLAETETRASMMFAKLLEVFSPFMPEAPEERERLRAALLEFDLAEFGARLAKYEHLQRAADRGDGDAALRYFSAARAVLVSMLTEGGQDATAFKHDILYYGAAPQE